MLVTGYTTVRVRKMVKTELLPADPMPKPAPFTSTERFCYIVIMLLGFGMALLYPNALGPVATSAAPFLLAATVVGYVLGTRLAHDLPFHASKQYIGKLTVETWYHQNN